MQVQIRETLAFTTIKNVCDLIVQELKVLQLSPL